MFHQPSIRNSHNKGSKVKRAVQIVLILTVVVWLLSRINKNDRAVGDRVVQVNLDQAEDINFGRKAKAGSENVVIIDGQKGDSDETPEMNETEDRYESSGHHTEGKKDDVSFSNAKVEPQEAISNTVQNEPREEQPGSKDDNGRDVVNHNTDDREYVLQLPSERDDEKSLDQDERGNGEIKVEIEGGNGESSSEVERNAIDPHQEDKLETEGNSENSSEAEKTESSDSHGGLESDPEGNSANNFEGTTAKESSDDASLFLPKEENGESNENESSEKSINDSHDDITSTETTIHSNKDEAEPISNEENEPMMQTNEEVPKRESVEFQDESTSKTVENGGLPVTNEVLERDATESNGDGASGFGRGDTEEQKRDLQSNEDAVESKDSREAENRAGNEAENSSHDNDENLETHRDEASHVEAAAESLGDIISREESAGNTVSEDTTEPKPNENTTGEFVNNNAESREDQGGENTGNTISENTTKLISKEDATSEFGNDNALPDSRDNINSQREDLSKEENTARTVSEDTTEPKPEADTTSQVDTNDAESHGEGFSKEENTDNTTTEVTTEPKPEDTASELDASLATSGSNDNADSSNGSGKVTD